jgi:hypothetical protein
MNEWKKIIFYAIIPAVIAGIFAIAPKLYDVLTAPKAELSYQITRGPVLVEGADQKSIYAIEVRNDGKKPLSGIYSELNTDNDIEAITTYQNTGLAPVINRDKKPFSVSIETLHPNEKFSISLMVTSKDSEPRIDFVIRSKEALGKKITPIQPQKSETIDFVSAFMAGLSVFVMSLVLFRRGKKGVPLPLFLDKPHILFYIAARLGLTEIVEKYELNEGSVTYLRFGDLLLSVGVSGDEQKKKDAIQGLKCLLLIDQIADRSRELIERNIRVLEGDDFSPDEISLIKAKVGKMSNQPALRDLIDEYVSNPPAFLTTLIGTPNKQIQPTAESGG